MTDEYADSPVAGTHLARPHGSGEVPRLPVRAPFQNQAMATAVGLWIESPDPDALERVVDGLRGFDPPERLQQEIDEVIARWRTGHSRGSSR